MTEPEIDYKAVFQALPGAVVLLTPELLYLDVNEEFLRQMGRTREQAAGGRFLGDDFAHSPNDPGAAVVRNVVASLRRVAETGERETMELQRYDREDPERPGMRYERYLSMINTPVFGPDGRMALLMHRVEDVTELIRAREVALSLQEAMLPIPRCLGSHASAARYRPAIDTLEVCGDWYDLVDLDGDRGAVAVGDVVGHGLPAAQVMGQLRSALSAASRTTEGPARALEVLGLYARSVEGAENTTAATAFIDWDTRTITYSSAGHPPPALLRGDGTVEFLDRATDPPLGARPEPAPRPQATASFTEGSVLVLYTDGLIERRHEDIDAGLARLARSLARHRAADPETLADALLADLLPPGGVTDDTALVIVRL
ncbi:SpoIIE family protein phosphatase [Streptomyces sp. 35G-GA-8]|uniref:PP2C family protein-serine/threonine phosphatase n=1 Tax=Streptomyces sp. 35G-GA-8 TaxID=2939434 RepID=UPI00201F9D16|nr:SpoIIE family protein phosphatase [Streptomyces sp. 35G-GA-8]MCL7375791.1 SpoIIE family protein phosphatase [Streptomyces sp. 35G-GA-8]